MGLINLYVKNVSGEELDAFDDLQWPFYDVDALELLTTKGKLKENKIFDLRLVNSGTNINSSPVLKELVESGLIEVYAQDASTLLTPLGGLELISFLRPADVIDDLVSDAESLPLSANQGKLLHLRVLALESQETYVETGIESGDNYMIQKNQDTFILQGAPSSPATMRLPNAQGNPDTLDASDVGWYVTVVNTNEFVGTIYLQYGGGFDYYNVEPDSFLKVTWNGSVYDITGSGINARSLNFQSLDLRFAAKDVEFTNVLSVTVTHDKAYIPLTEVWVKDENQILVKAEVHVAHDWVNKNSFEVTFGKLTTGRILYR